MEEFIMKTWTMPEIETVELGETAFGPNQNFIPDREKTQVFNDDGVLVGAYQFAGEFSGNNDVQP